MNQPRRGTPDFLLLILTFILVAFGLVMVFDTSSMATVYYKNDPWFFTKKQALWVLIGTILMFIVMNIHYSKYKKWFFPLFILVVFLLILVLIMGQEINHAKSWFRFGSIGIQPAEFAKLVTVMYLSALIAKKEEKIREFKNGLLPILVIIGSVTFLIMLEPDLGTAMILVLCSLILALVGRVSLKQLSAVGFVFITVAGVAIGIFLLFHPDYSSYRINRFTAFLNPWSDPLDSGYQIIQSLYAFGHGGLTGAGFGQGIQKINYLSQAYNDFIFSTIGEELGFIGSTIFLLVYLLFLWRGLLISIRCTDLFGTLVSVGIVGMIGIQALINLGGVTNSIPLTGVTLPLISYGGSSMLITMISIGVLLNISREYDKNTYIKKEA